MSSIDPASLGVVLTGSSLYVSLLPPLKEVRRADPDSETASDVHIGVGMASVVLIGSGALITYLGSDRRALYMTIAMSVLMALVYEATLRLRGASDPAPRQPSYPV